MSDLLSEVDDDLRRQQLDKFWQENKNWIIGGIILAIATTAALTWWRTWDYQRNLAQTQELRKIEDKNDVSALTDYAKNADRNHAALAKLLAAGQLTRDGKTVPLTTGEFSVLKVLVQHPREPMSRDKLMELARGREYEVFDRSIDVQISRLRKIVEEDPSHPKHIQTVWGFGYVFVPE